MSEPQKWRSYAQEGRGALALLVGTLVLTVAVDLTVAIAVGVALGFVLRRFGPTLPEAVSEVGQPASR